MKFFIKLITLSLSIFFLMHHVQAAVLEGSLIVTPQGNKPVEELRVGDAICGYDEKQNAAVQSKLLQSTSAQQKSWF